MRDRLGTTAILLLYLIWEILQIIIGQVWHDAKRASLNSNCQGAAASRSRGSSTGMGRNSRLYLPAGDGKDYTYLWTVAVLS